VPNQEVRAFAAANDATAYDIPGRHVYARRRPVQFDAFIRIHALAHPALDALATIVRAADTSNLPLAAQAPACFPCRSACPRCSPTTTRC
jgi:hypothetical protein